jgi:ribonuclease HII
MSKCPPLQITYRAENKYEIGIDEAGRGPLFGRLYVAATILPKDESFRHCDMKDSKKIHSKKKMKEIAEYIKQNSIAWHIQYVDADIIDKINIRQSVLKSMHECATQVMQQIKLKNDIDQINPDDFMLLVDGNDFTPHLIFDNETESFKETPFETIEGGDNKYTSIAAASILAKNERDNYIEELCKQHPLLIERYGMDKNMGYATEKHRSGITEYGITQWHRKTYGICKQSKFSPI